MRTSTLFLTALITLSTCLLSTVSSASDKAEEAFKERLKERNTPTTRWDGPDAPEMMTLDDWQMVKWKSKKEPLLIYKHSHTCGLSAEVGKRVDTWLKNAPESAPELHFVIVRARRPVSNAIERDLGVIHESPQIFLIQDGKSLWDADHDEITADAIDEAIQSYVGTPTIQNSHTKNASETLELAQTKLKPHSEEESKAILKPKQENIMFIEMDVDTNEVFEGQPIILTTRLWRIKHARINSGPYRGANIVNPTTDDFEVHELENEMYDSTRGPWAYDVSESRKRLYPTGPGDFQIGPWHFEGLALINRSSTISRDKLYYKLDAGPINIKVKPAPTSH